MDEENIPSYLKFLPVYNYVNSNKIKLPTKFNKEESSHWLRVSDDGLKITYDGPGLSNFDVGAIRGNRIPSEVELFYYEMSVINKCIHGYIGLGFCEPNLSLRRMPGWDVGSYGYHGDDGKRFSSSREDMGLGNRYGPLFTTGDTVGVGINNLNNTMFFTKNGIHLGAAFTDIDNRNLHPMIGMRSPGECVVVNFGQKQFMFDIDQYAQNITNTAFYENDE